MSEENPLDREATDEELAEVERLLKATTAEIVPIRRAPAKPTTDVLALPVLPALPPIPAEKTRTEEAAFLPFVDPKVPVWMRSVEGIERARTWAGRNGSYPKESSRDQPGDVFRAMFWGPDKDD
jgi:hypothetical protein